MWRASRVGPGCWLFVAACGSDPAVTADDTGDGDGSSTSTASSTSADEAADTTSSSESSSADESSSSSSDGSSTSDESSTGEPAGPELRLLHTVTIDGAEQMLVSDYGAGMFSDPVRIDPEVDLDTVRDVADDGLAPGRERAAIILGDEDDGPADLYIVELDDPTYPALDVDALLGEPPLWRFRGYSPDGLSAVVATRDLDDDNRALHLVRLGRDPAAFPIYDPQPLDVLAVTFTAFPPDGSAVTYSLQTEVGAGANAYIRDVTTEGLGEPRALTTTIAADLYARVEGFTADSTVAVITARQNSSIFGLLAADLTADPPTADIVLDPVLGDGQLFQVMMSPIGDAVAYSRVVDFGLHDLWMVRFDGAIPSEPIRVSTDSPTPSVVSDFVWSPDGRWIAYLSWNGADYLGYIVDVAGEPGVPQFLGETMMMLFDPQSAFLYFIGNDGLHQVELTPELGDDVVLAPFNVASNMYLSPNGEWLIYYEYQPSPLLWLVDTTDPSVEPVELHVPVAVGEDVRMLEFSADSDHVLYKRQIGGSFEPGTAELVDLDDAGPGVGFVPPDGARVSGTWDGEVAFLPAW